MTAKQIDALIPAGTPGGYQGPWLGWYLRALLTPSIGYREAQYVVAMALGPGFDYEAPNNDACVTTPRGKRDKKNGKPKQRRTP